ncbi:hypothetical protein [Mesorhizobium sp.]|uniref:hypothetical protein n=1 Tax=Mesorhizobium sp. TaxID=1871066 RepID=UPI000FEA940D|nr:hypothetical protein [Mesorhizobium sp.]RWO89563.1 MAG: hypothetical protein EOQ96_05225 [Mesorhizobium sp.]
MAATWVSRLPDTREDLIGSLNYVLDVMVYQDAGLTEIKSETATASTNLKALIAKVNDSGLDDKAKLDLSVSIQTVAEQLAKVSHDTGNLITPLQQTSVDQPTFAWALISRADAASAKPVRPSRAEKAWIEKPGNKLWLAIALGLVFAVPFFALYVATGNAKKHTFCEKVLTSIMSFYLGLAGGAALPNL